MTLSKRNVSSYLMNDASSAPVESISFIDLAHSVERSARKLDTIKAAVLIGKLKILTEEIERRSAIAARCNEAQADVARIPVVLNECTSVAKSVGAFAEALKAQKSRSGLLSVGFAPADGISPLSGRRLWLAGIGDAGALGHQPANAPLRDDATQDCIVRALREY